MTLKEQLNTIKKNWILVLVLLLFVLLPFFSGTTSSLSKSSGFGMPMMESAEMAIASDSMGKYYGGSDFAPEVEDRKITKNAYLSTEVERGTFQDSANKLKSVVKLTDSYLLDENVNKYGTDKKSYYSGSYQIKVETSKYDSMILQLKEIGEVQSFTESMDDITARYTNLQTELDAEKSRLAKFQQMYNQADEISDKIALVDKIYSLEKTIDYLEQALSNVQMKVDYSTIRVNLQEERSEYANVALVKFSKLIDSLVDSFNSLLQLIFVIFPYAIALGLVWLVVRVVRKRR
jgi:hypothetical protein